MKEGVSFWHTLFQINRMRFAYLGELLSNKWQKTVAILVAEHLGVIVG